MQTSRIRVTTISAATLALLLAGTMAASAHPGDRDEFPGVGLGMGRQGMGGPGWDDTGMGDMGMGDMGMDGLGMGRMGRLGGLFGDAAGGFVRSETTIQAEDGSVTTQRTDQGTVSATTGTSLDYSLATGEAASVTTDADTQVISVGVESVDVGDSGRTRDRLVPESVALTDIPAGATVVVWAESQADGSYLAQRILVRPAADAAATSDGSDTDDTAGDAGSGITEVPASPAPADA